jgi:hypothetical protein
MQTIHYLCTRAPTEFYTVASPQIVIASRASFYTRACTEVAGYAPGATALASGYNFSSANKNFSVGVNDKTPTTITLNASCGTDEAIITHINSQLSTAGLANDVAAYAVTGDKVGIKSVSIWGSKLTLAAGAQDALTVLGISPGTYDPAMTSGYNFSTNSPTFGISVNSGTPVTLTLSQSVANVAATVAYINSVLTTASVNEVEAFVIASTKGYIGLRSKNYSTAVTFTLTAGTNFDALKILGWLPGAYTEDSTAGTFSVEVRSVSDNTTYAVLPDDFYIASQIGVNNILPAKLYLNTGDKLLASASARCKVGLTIVTESI